MSFTSWLRALRSPVAPIRAEREHRKRAPRAVPYRPRLEALEDRYQPSFLAAVSYAAGAHLQAIVAADFNGDTRLDLAVANESSNTVSVLLGNAGGTFQSAQDSPTGAGPHSVAVGDFNSDGKLDIATANLSDVSILLGDGAGAFQLSGNTAIGSDNPQSVAVGDFDGNGKLDLAVTSNLYVLDGYGDYGTYYHYEGHASVVLGNGDGTFAAPTVNDLGYGRHASAVVADFNGDAKLDFAEANVFRSTVSVLLGDGAGRLLTPTDFFVPYAPESLNAGLLNSDGYVDLVSASPGANSVSVLLGNGMGGFGSARYFEASYYAHSVALGDFNNDNHLDIATPGYATDMTVVLGYGDGTFAHPRNFAVGAANSWDVAAGDFNGDGWLDVATANFNGGSVAVLINDQSWPPPPPPTISINDVSFLEGNSGASSASFTVRLSAAYNQPVTVHFTTADGTATAGSDYAALSGDVTFAPGETSKTITVAVLGDRLGEPNETLFVNLNNPTNATIVDGQGQGTIVDDEPRISIGDVTKKEGNGKKATVFTFTVSLSVPYDQPVIVSYRTTDGTAATGDGDYLGRTGTLTFAPGETTKTATIEVKSDNKKETDETFYLDLFDNSVHSWFAKSRGTGAILNDD